MPARKPRDVGKGYAKADFVMKLGRLADAIENDARFVIQIDGERIHVPVRATFTVEHERSAAEEEIEFQIKWQHPKCEPPCRVNRRHCAEGASSPVWHRSPPSSCRLPPVRNRWVTGQNHGGTRQRWR